jgi:hypothetical protein
VDSTSGNIPPSQPDPETEREGLDFHNRSGLIYCGLCGALNPSTNHFCARCGSTLVDAFHPTEGLRVFQNPDDASRLVEILTSGAPVEMLPDDDAPLDYARVRLEDGRLGYVKQSDLQARNAIAANPGAGAGFEEADPPDINTNARGCVTPSAALGAIGLVLVLSVLLYVVFDRGREEDSGIILLFFCITVVPILVLLVALYVSARAREDRRIADEEDAIAERSE